MIKAEENDLPPGWTTARLDSIVSSSGVFSDGDWVESKDQDPNGKVRLVQLADVGEMAFLDKSSRFMTIEKAQELNCTYLKKGDLLISRLGDPLGKTCLFPAIEEQAVTVVDVCILRPDHRDIETKLFGHFLNGPNLRRIIDEQSSGTTRKRITGKKLKALNVPVPPTNEQRRIVEKIESLFVQLEKGEEGLREVQKLLARYRQSVLKAAVTGQLTADWRTDNADRLEHGRDLLARILQTRRETWEGRGKYKEPAAADTTDLPELPEGWLWTTLGALISNGPQNGLYLPQSKYGAGTPILRIDDYQLDWLRPSQELRRVEASNDERSKYALAPGDFVINRVNSVSHLGKTTLVSAEYEGTLFESNMMRFGATNEVSAEYLRLYLTSGIGRKRLIKNLKHAVNQASINQGDVEATPVPLPSKEEQLEIVQTVSKELSGETATNAYCETELARSGAVRQSILKEAFSGTLVPQDPSDEPAADLLERIRKARPAAPKKARRRVKA